MPLAAPLARQTQPERPMADPSPELEALRAECKHDGHDWHASYPYSRESVTAPHYAESGRVYSCRCCGATMKWVMASTAEAALADRALVLGQTATEPEEG